MARTGALLAAALQRGGGVADMTLVLHCDSLWHRPCASPPLTYHPMEDPVTRGEINGPAACGTGWVMHGSAQGAIRPVTTCLFFRTLIPYHDHPCGPIPEQGSYRTTLF